VTVCASLAREIFVKQSCGNDGAMESQLQAFHIAHSSGDGLFYWSEKGLKKKKPKAVYTKVFTPPALFASASEKSCPSASRSTSKTYTLCSMTKRRALAAN
jgi:hypothetical protein